VFAANMTGTFFAALFCTFTPVLTPELRHGMLEISRHMMENDWGEMFFKGISAGFLIAAMVWLVPSADTAKFHAVTLMTYLIAIGGFTHIVAGSMEAFLLVANRWNRLVRADLPRSGYEGDLGIACQFDCTWVILKHLSLSEIKFDRRAEDRDRRFLTSRMEHWSLLRRGHRPIGVVAEECPLPLRWGLLRLVMYLATEV
jgi:Formate/nitrite transporter